MNKNLIFRILGILGGLLVIVSLFLPYFSLSLWQLNMKQNNLYLSIVIIVFGLLPVILYSLNKKMEFAYMSVGALAFFSVTQIVDALSSNNLGALGIGFYLLTASVVIMAISTFALGKNAKINVLNEQISSVSNNISNPMESNGVDVQISDSQNDLSNPLANPIEEISGLDGNDNSIDNNNSGGEEIVETLGEEIPEFQSEDGINPVVSEFVNADSSNTSNEVPETPSTIEEVVATPEVPETPSTTGEVVATPEVPETPSTGEDVMTTSDVLDVQGTGLPAGDSTSEASDNSNLNSTPEESNAVNPALELANDIGVPAPSEDTVQPEVGETAANENVVEEQPAATSQNSIMPEIAFDEPQQEIPTPQEPQFDIFGQPK